VQNTDDISELAKTMAASATPATFRKLAAAADSLKERFTLDAMLDQTEMLYWKLAERRRIRVTA
jgi:hypothetical protein